MSDKNTLISGVPANIGGVLVKQPTLHEMFKVIGYDVYSTYIFVVGMTVEQFLESTGLQGAFDELPAEAKEQINIYELLLAEPSWRGLLVKALSFFILGDIVFDEDQHRLLVIDEGGTATEITKDMFGSIRDFIFQAACLKNENEYDKPQKFKNDKAKEIFEKLAKGRKQHEQLKKATDKSMEIWNLIGAVSAHSYTYNLLSIWQLTVWQLHDQFGRICKQEYLDGYASKWAVWGTDKFDFDGWYKVEKNEK